MKIFMIVVVTKYAIIRVIQPRRMRWAGNVILMVDRRGAYRILMGKPE